MDVTVTSDQHLCWMSNTGTSGGNAPNGQTIVEFSGICDSGLNPNTFYVHEDSGNGAWFYAYGYNGTLKKCIQIDTSVNGVAYGDMEDICYHQSTKTIWLANSGNNSATTPTPNGVHTFVVMKFTEPDLTGSNPATTMMLTPTVYQFGWPGNVPTNCEIIMISPAGRLYFVSKEASSNVTWPTRLYAAPVSLAAYPTVNALTPVATWTQASSVSGGDWSSDGKLIVTRNHGGAAGGNLNFYDPTDFSFIKSVPMAFVMRDNVATSMAESLCFNKDCTAIFAGTEGNGAETRILAYTTPTGNPGNAPTASFTAIPSNVAIGTPVAFTDTSTNTPTSWAWLFGDGSSSALQNPTHTYTSSGQFTVQLTATNAYGSNTTTKTITSLPVSNPRSMWKFNNGAGWKNAQVWSDPSNKKQTEFVNLLVNPNFEVSSQGVQGWSSTTGTLDRSTTDLVKDGVACLLNTVTLASGTAFYMADQVACSPGDVFSAAAWLCWKTGATPRDCRVDIQFYDVNRTLVTGGTLLGTDISTNTSSYVHVTNVNKTAPAGAASVRLRVSILATVAGEKILLDAAQLEKASSLTPYPSAPPNLVSPIWSESLRNTLGVNTHFSFGTSTYSYIDATVNKVLELGCKHIRDKVATTGSPNYTLNGNQNTAFSQLAAGGSRVHTTIFSDPTATNADIDSILDVIIAHPTWFASVGGTNEPQNLPIADVACTYTWAANLLTITAPSGTPFSYLTDHVVLEFSTGGMAGQASWYAIATKVSNTRLTVTHSGSGTGGNVSVCIWASVMRDFQKRISDRLTAKGLTQIKKIGPALMDATATLEKEFTRIGYTDIGSYIDMGDYHRYPLSGGTGPTPTPTSLIDERQGWARAAYGKQDLFQTEGGFNDAVDTDPKWLTSRSPIPEDVGGWYTPRLWLELVNRGVKRFFFYELLDDPDPSVFGGTSSIDTWEFHTGLVAVEDAKAALSQNTANWRNKPSFNALKAITTWLVDTSPGAGSYNPDTNPYVPTPVNFTISGPSDLCHMLVQKVNGDTRLYMWRDIPLWSKTNKDYVADLPATATITTDYGSEMHTVSGVMTYMDLPVSPPVNTSVDFVWLSDFQLTNAASWGTSHDNAVTQLNAINPDYLFIGGDIADGGQVSQYAVFDSKLASWKPKMIPIAGNHDYSSDPNLTNWWDYFCAGAVGTVGKGVSGAKPWWSFITSNGWLVLVLAVSDTGTSGIGQLGTITPYYGVGSEQYNWIQSTLAANRSKPKLAIWHVPRYSTDGSHGDHNTGADEEELWELLRANSVDLIINGHVHVPQRFPAATGSGTLSSTGPVEFTASGIQQRTPSQTSALIPDYVSHVTPPQLLHLTLNTDSYSWEFIRATDGVVMNSNTKASYNAVVIPE